MSFDDPVASFTPDVAISEEAFFFNLSLDLLAIIDSGGYFKRVNAAFTQILGYSEAELQAQPFIEFIHPDDRAATLAEVEKLKVGVPTLHFDNRYRTKAGEYRWFSWSASPFTDWGVIYCVARDVTQQKQTEAALRESEERWQLALRGSNDGIWDWNVQTNEVFFSARWKSMLGYAEHEISHHVDEWAKRVHPEDLGWVTQVIQDHFAKKIPFYISEHRVQCKDGTYKWILDRGQAIWDESGRVLRMVGSHTDVTERRELEAALHRTNQELEQRVAERTTELEQANLALQRSQAKLQQQLVEIETIYQSAPVGLSILDPDLRFVRINQRLAEINGFSVAEHLGRSIRELLPELADEAEKLLHRVLETGEPHLNVEIRGETPAQPGVLRVWLENFLPLKDGDRVIGISIVCEEITDRKRAEEALRESEERFRQLAENIEEAVFWIHSLEHPEVIYISPAYERIWGRSRDSLYANHIGWLDAVHLDDRQRIQAAFREYSHATGYDEEYRIVRPDGSIRWIRDRGFPIRDQSGQPYRVVGLAEDVTERKQVEANLRQSEESYRTLFESLEDGFCVIEILFDPGERPVDYRFLETNPAFQQQTGLKAAVGKTARQLLPDLEEFWFETYGTVARTGEPIRFENGSEAMRRWFEVYAFPVGLPEQRRVAILFKDISDRKAVETQREKLLQQEQAAREAAESANRMKDEFLAVLSHELRTPLNPILGWSRLLQASQVNPEKLQQGLSTIERNARQQVQLIDDLLDISRIIRGQITLSFTAVQLPEPLLAALETVRLAAEAKALKLEVQLDPLVGSVQGDASRLQQVLWNLLSNAIKFTPTGGHVTLTLSQVSNQAQIQVRDTGKGIQPEFLPHVFELFRQQDSSTTRSFGGLGLGLAIARQVVEAHGGTITAESSGEGQGSTFTIQLPLIPQANAENFGSSGPRSPNLANLRVLAVDDEVDSLELVRVVLADEGVTVRTVDSAVAALQILQQEFFDLLISDIGMPGMDGYAFIQQVRQLPPPQKKIQAIAVTAYAGESNQQRILAAGFQAHLAKPIDPDQLLEAIAAVIAP